MRKQPTLMFHSRTCSPERLYVQHVSPRCSSKTSSQADSVSCVGLRPFFSKQKETSKLNHYTHPSLIMGVALKNQCSIPHVAINPLSRPFVYSMYLCCHKKEQQRTQCAPENI